MIHIFLCKNTDAVRPEKDGKAPSGDCRQRLLRAGLQVLSKKKDPDDVCPPDPLLCVHPGGKPFFPDFPDVHFSLSHSGAYMACAFSGQEVGLDLQECSFPHAGSLRIARRFFTGQEYRLLSSMEVPQDREALFFLLWAVKEAFLKYTGCGLRGGMDSFLPDPLPSVLPSVFHTAHQSGTLHCFRGGENGIREGAEAEAEAATATATETETETETEQEPEAEAEKGTGAGAGAGTEEGSALLTRGKIRVLREHDLLTPAEYGLLPAPAGYVLAVSAQTLPDEIILEWI